MDTENSLAAPQVGTIDYHLPVESPRTQQGGIKNIGPVGCGNDNNAAVLLKTIHFHKQLIERLLSFVMTAAKAGPSLTPDRVDFIDEDNTGRALLPLFKKIADTARSHTNEHLHKVGPPDGQRRSPPGESFPQSLWNFPGSLRNSMISCSSAFASSAPATSMNVTRF